MSMKLSHNQPLTARWLTQINCRLFASRGTASCELAGREIHEDPAPFFMPIRRVIGLRIFPGLIQRLYHDGISK